MATFILFYVCAEITINKLSASSTSSAKTVSGSDFSSGKKCHPADELRVLRS